MLDESNKKYLLGLSEGMVLVQETGKCKLKRESRQAAGKGGKGNDTKATGNPSACRNVCRRAALAGERRILWQIQKRIWCGYREKPHKEGDAHNGERVTYWAEPRSMDSFVTNFDGLAYHLFSEIKGTDAEPTSIGELLAEKILEELGGIDAGGKQIQNFFQRQGFL